MGYRVHVRLEKAKVLLLPNTLCLFFFPKAQTSERRAGSNLDVLPKKQLLTRLLYSAGNCQTRVLPSQVHECMHA